MPIRYDSVLVGALAAELRTRLAGARLEELHLDPDGRTVRLGLGDGTLLVWLLHPTAGHLLAVEGEEEVRARRKRPRGVLRGARQVAGVEAPPDERRLRIRLEPVPRPRPEGGDDGTEALVVELHTNQWNALHVSGGRIHAVLWRRSAGDRSLREGAEYGPPPGARLGADRPLSEEEWRRLWTEADPERRRDAALRRIAWISPTNADWVFGSPGDDAGSVPERLARLREAGAGGEGHGAADAGPRGDRPAKTAGAWLLARPWGPQPYPLALDEEDAAPFPSLLAAMAEAAGREGIPIPGGDAPAGGRNLGSAPVEPESERIGAALRALLERTRRRRRGLARELAAGPDSGALRATGDLLLAWLREVPPGADSVRLADFDGTERTVRLDAALDAAANAGRYYERARRRERAERRLPRRIEAAGRRERRLRALLRRLRDAGPTDEMREIVDRLAPGAGPAGKREVAVRRSWRSLRSSGGLEIRVGRSARDNDDLTFHHSAPEDIWLHARHVHGAHVILRWGRRDQDPPERDLHDAAVAAAVFSEARTSGTVAVDWTRRKHVRKPRKAPPGAVVPDRVRTLFVPPDAGRVRRMHGDGPDAG